jgi:hypothetical protein
LVNINDIAFWIICGLALISVSVMLYIRLSAAEAPKGILLYLLARLWVSFALAVGLLAWIGSLLGPAASGGAETELTNIGQRWQQLSQMQMIEVAAAGAAILILFLSVSRAIRRILQHYPPPWEKKDDGTE